VPSWVCLNGTLMAAGDARVSVFDSGFMQGIGLFETMRAYDGRIFRQREHLARLADSARQLGWTVLPDVAALEADVQQVLRAITGQDARVRVTVTTGTLHADEDGPPRLTVVVSATPGEPYANEFYTRGVTALLAPYRQNPADPTTGHKTTSYFARLAALRLAHAQGAFESIWLTYDELVAEGSISNLFAVQDEVLITPPLDTPVLPGITRAAVLQLAAEEQIPLREQTIELDELRAADEVFLTNSMAELVPVVRIDRRPVANEKPGEITRILAIAYGKLIDRELD
jgi:branched-chain amino acid aminotransferase